MSQKDFCESLAQARRATNVEAHPIVKKLLDHLPTDLYVRVSVLNSLLEENISMFVNKNLDLLEGFMIHVHRYSNQRYLCYSGPHLDPPVKRGLDIKDCFAEDTNLVVPGDERAKRRLRLQRLRDGTDKKRAAIASGDRPSRVVRPAERSPLQVTDENRVLIFDEEHDAAPRSSRRKLKDVVDENTRLTAKVAAAETRIAGLEMDLQHERHLNAGLEMDLQCERRFNATLKSELESEGRAKAELATNLERAESLLDEVHVERLHIDELNASLEVSRLRNIELQAGNDQMRTQSGTQHLDAMAARRELSTERSQTQQKDKEVQCLRKECNELCAERDNLRAKLERAKSDAQEMKKRLAKTQRSLERILFSSPKLAECGGNVSFDTYERKGKRVRPEWWRRASNAAKRWLASKSGPDGWKFEVARLAVETGEMRNLLFSFPWFTDILEKIIDKEIHKAGRNEASCAQLWMTKWEGALGQERLERVLNSTSSTYKKRRESMNAARPASRLATLKTSISITLSWKPVGTSFGVGAIT